MIGSLWWALLGSVCLMFALVALRFFTDISPVLLLVSLYLNLVVVWVLSRRLWKAI